MGEGHLGLAHLDSNSLNEMLAHTEPKLSVYDSYTGTVLITQDTGHCQTCSRKFLHTNF